jgi:hypothetical protein
MTSPADEAAIAVVRRNTEQVQGKGNWDVFDELFADSFVDHTPQPGATPDKDGVRMLYRALRTAFPDFRADIHWQIATDKVVTTYKIYHGTQTGPILGIAPPAGQSSSNPSTSCESSTARSPTTGAWETYSNWWCNSAPSRSTPDQTRFGLAFRADGLPLQIAS